MTERDFFPTELRLARLADDVANAAENHAAQAMREIGALTQYHNRCIGQQFRRIREHMEANHA